MYNYLRSIYSSVLKIKKTREKETAIRLRQNGRSLSEIKDEIGVSKSSVSTWCRNIELTSNQLERLQKKRPEINYGAIANKTKRQEQIVQIKTDARKNLRKLYPEDSTRLKDIGIAIYWAEGTKTGHYVDFTNSDPRMVYLMMKWFRDVCLVPEHKFRVSIFYHSGQDESKMREYWSEITGVHLNQFHKSIFKKEGTGQRRNILYNGTCKVRICDCDLLHRILAWIEQLHLNTGP